MNFNISKVELSKYDIKRNLLLPTKSSKELAEFMGILTGDGCVGHYPKTWKYDVVIAGDSKLDYYYLSNHVSNIVKELFNLNSSIYKSKNENSIRLNLSSKGLANYMIYLGFKKGKKEQISIPSWILLNKE